MPPQVKSWLIGKDSDAGRDWGQEEKGTTEDEMAGWHHWLDGLSLSELREFVMDREAWRAVTHGVVKSRTRLSDWTELNIDKKRHNQEYNQECAGFRSTGLGKLMTFSEMQWCPIGCLKPAMVRCFCHRRQQDKNVKCIIYQYTIWHELWDNGLVKESTF